MSQINERTLGQYFSRSYLDTGKPRPDDPRARHRLAVYLSEYFDDGGGQAGKFIERELGIKCVQSGYASSCVSWEEFLSRLAVRDLLDVLTAILKFKPNLVRYSDRTPIRYDFLGFSRRVFSEHHLPFEIDDVGGVHPKVDVSFSLSFSFAIRSLQGVNLQAARQHIEKAETALLESQFDGRTAVRAVFDAAENILKQFDSRATQLNKDSINSVLRPKILLAQGSNLPEQRAAGKMIDGFIDWVDAAHFFRHEPGSAELFQPSETFAVAFVSQGFCHIRWLADAFAKQP